MEDLPIDIHVGKLSEWLVSRRHVQHGWQTKLLTVREKINSALKDMPEHPQLKQLLTGAYLNYWHVKKIVEILKETEADSKNLFGYYSSQRMKDWQEIQKLYEKDNLYLAEAAQHLSRTVNYEIPGSKRQISKLQQQQEEYERKENECVKNSENLKEQYKNACSALGISGEKPRREIVAMLDSLPEVFTKVAQDCKELTKARGFYKKFLDFCLSSDNGSDCLPLVEYMAGHGNTTVYEWRYGEPPVSIEPPKLDIKIEDDDETQDDSKGDIDAGEEIDFSSFDISSGGDDFVQLETGDIDWTGGVEESSISWEDDSTVIVDEGGDWQSEIKVEGGGIEGGVARDNEALTLLDYDRTRSQFMDELFELESFLSQRDREVSEDSTVFQINTLPSHLQLSKCALGSMLSTLSSIIAAIHNVKMQHLYLIKTSPKYVDRLADSVQQKLRLADKMLNTKSNYIEKREKAATEEQQLHPNVQKMVKQCKDLQKHIEEDISRRYKDRPVHLLGMAAAS